MRTNVKPLYRKLTNIMSGFQPAFIRFLKDYLRNCDELSNDDSASDSEVETKFENSDFEDNSEVEDFEDDSEAGEDTITKYEAISERNWQCIAPSDSNRITLDFARQGALTEKSKDVESIEDCFRLFINTKIIDNIILYTNKKAEESRPASKTWKRLDRIEMDAFFGLLLLIGRFRDCYEKKQDLWKVNEALSRQIYLAVMSRDRFLEILKYLRFDDSTTRTERKAHDRLAPLRDITNIFIENCKESYNATDVGCMNEQLIRFRGHCSFRVYMPNKPGNYGIKVWTLCDATTFYCCNIHLHSGKQEHQTEKQQGQHIVKDLVNMWKHSNRCITIDNFCIDFNLAEELLKDNIFLVGTAQSIINRELPESFLDIKNRSQYSSEFLFTDNLTVVSYLPKRKKCEVVFSTLHHDREVSTAKKKFRPTIINYYNATKNGVDVLDRLVKEYSCRHATRRWPWALFMHFIDIAAYNAFVIWHTKYPTWESKISLQMRRRQFLQSLGEKLTAKNIDRRATEFEQGHGVLHKSIVKAIEATGRKIGKPACPASQKRARCRLCVGSDHKYNTKCNYCNRHVCKNHSNQAKVIMCNICNSMNLE